MAWLGCSGITALYHTFCFLNSPSACSLPLQAKSAGRQIEEIRSRIGHHKDSIEKLRKHHAISMVSGHEYNDDEEAKANERLHCDAIEREKAAYKDILERLRGLKGTIEKTQQEVEKRRLKLQSDFDTWYHRACSEESQRANLQPGAIKQANPKAEGARAEPKSHDRVPTASINETDDEFKLPPGIQLTGNAEADADIIAFYKAKEVLLSSRR